MEYKFTDDGIKAAEKQLRGIYDGNNILSKKPLAEQLGLVEETTAPAADRIVKLTHNSEPHRESIKKLDELIEEVDKKNEPKYKQAAAHLKAAKALLEAPELRKTDWQAIKGWFGWIERVITLAGPALELFDSVYSYIKGFFQ